jgi:hypothetical protein
MVDDVDWMKDHLKTTIALLDVLQYDVRSFVATRVSHNVCGEPRASRTTIIGKTDVIK